MTEQAMTERDWREVPRREMHERVMVALDCARGEAETAGDHHYARYLEDAVMPFVEAEFAKVRLEDAGAVCVLMEADGPYTWGDPKTEANISVFVDERHAKKVADATGLEVLVLTTESLKEHLAGDWSYVTDLVVSPPLPEAFRDGYELSKARFLGQ